MKAKDKYIFYRAINDCKFKSEHIWRFEKETVENGHQHFFFAKSVDVGGKYDIVDARTGLIIMRNLSKLKQKDFNQICKFIMRCVDLKKYQAEKTRVSKLKTSNEKIMSL